jgi:hypothetical protein
MMTEQWGRAESGKLNSDGSVDVYRLLLRCVLLDLVWESHSLVCMWDGGVCLGGVSIDLDLQEDY